MNEEYDVCGRCGIADYMVEFDGDFALHPQDKYCFYALSNEVKTLREQLTTVTQERDKALADAQGVVNVLGFFSSCIKSGEQWTPQCDDMLHTAFAHRNKK